MQAPIPIAIGGQITNLKHQMTNKSQIPNRGSLFRGYLEFDNCDLEFVVIYCLSIHVRSFSLHPIRASI